MSFQDKINMTMSKVLSHPEYKIPYNSLKERANMKAMDLKFEQTQKQAEKEGMEI